MGSFEQAPRDEAHDIGAAMEREVSYITAHPETHHVHEAAGSSHLNHEQQKLALLMRQEEQLMKRLEETSVFFPLRRVHIAAELEKNRALQEVIEKEIERVQQGTQMH